MPDLSYGRKCGHIDVTLEEFRGRPQVRVRDHRGFFVVVGIEDAVDVAKAIDSAVTAYVDFERAKKVAT